LILDTQVLIETMSLLSMVSQSFPLTTYLEQIEEEK